MGELSKTIGELGENITLDNVLLKLGWRGSKNPDIACSLQKKHGKKKHGIDVFSFHADPLASDFFTSITTSVKYNEVPANNGNFLTYAHDLTTASECVEHSSEYTNLLKGKHTRGVNHSCVLFWLNHTSPEERNLLPKIGDINSALNFHFNNVYLVDNLRISFLYKSISFAEQLFNNSSVEFLYSSSSINDNIYGQRREAEKILPVEFINSPILPFRIITKEQQKVLAICLNENFTENGLRRLMGLSQALTYSWCNKIVLAFPDYQFIHHGATKQIVASDFENSFSDMVEVMSYNNSFKNLEQNADLSFYDNHTSAKEENNTRIMLPFGDRMRQLLIQSYIRKQDIKTLLSKRGVFVSDQATKNDLVPLISKMLLSPTEFDFLRRKQLSKESSEKVSSQYLIIDEKFTNEDLLPILKSSFGGEIVSKIILSNYPNCQLTGFPTFHLDKGGDIQIEFQITRDDLTKDWATASTTFTGQVVIKPIQIECGVEKCRIDTISTSIETKNISKQIIEEFIKHLKEQKLISSVVQPTRLMANSVVSRSNFLFKFLSEKDKISNSIHFQELLNVEFKMSALSKESISEDIESLKDKIRTSVFKGNSLQEITYISNPKYREVFDFYVKTCLFAINLPSIRGTAQIEFGFPDLKNKPDNKAEFEFKIFDIVPVKDTLLSSRERHEAEIAIREEFNNMKERAYQLTEKTARQTTLAL